MLDIQLLDDEPRRCPVCRQAGRSPCLLYHHLNRAQDFAPYVTRQMQIDAVSMKIISALVSLVVHWQTRAAAAGDNFHLAPINVERTTDCDQDQGQPD